MHKAITEFGTRRQEDKIWGTTYTLLRTDACSNHLLKIKPNYRCSRHTHRLRVNQFVLISGDIRVLYYPPGSTTPTEVKLMPMVPFSVYPGVLHWFESRDVESIMLETYVGVVDVDDIERHDEGRALST